MMIKIGSGYVTGFQIVLIVAIVFGGVYQIVKMGLEHSEKLERIKHGYPLKDGSTKMEKGADVIDYRGNFGNDGRNEQADRY